MMPGAQETMAQPVLLATGLSKRFGAHAVLEDVSLAIAPGCVLGLIGPNGSGKTTLIRLLTGLLKPDRGEVHIAGVPLASAPARARAALGHAPEPTLLPPNLSGWQALEVIAAARGLKTVPQPSLTLAERLGLSGWLNRPVGHYSLGTRQKLAVVQALLDLPPLLVLDEVLNGLDPIAAFELKQHLAELARAGHAVLLATHGLEAAVDLLHAAVVLIDGRIARRFDAAELDQCRAAGPGAFEAAVVAAIRGATGAAAARNVASAG